ncbi:MULTISPECIES: nitroreductase family protein [unclassified Acinetobacter]|uniref:nitroreductase family protein n=1 Tax=unclassified Acinetobacter TaxID=196816 RepID=UPI0010238E74|nr:MULTISPECIES: nitroreductase family protein [unclassified Acinetobacter]RZG72808.1 nitroreductase family protein [Acinetobacter sp. WCHAc060025]RZG79940.1 nitroreductase family protein [Acinetobacter sp. WCHAc060033]
MSKDFNDLIKNRRSIYAIGKNVKFSADEVAELIQTTVANSPSAFNSQTSRVVILFNQEHQKYWDIVKEVLKPFAPNEEAAAATNAKIDSFAAGFGTALFFEDQDVVKTLQDQFPGYADNFPIWSEQSTGIAQFAVWTALAEQGIGASLQHYNPLVDEKVAAQWNLPANWKLRAQLVFGSIEASAGEKEYMDRAQRFRVFK